MQVHAIFWLPVTPNRDHLRGSRPLCALQGVRGAQTVRQHILGHDKGQEPATQRPAGMRSSCPPPLRDRRAATPASCGQARQEEAGKRYFVSTAGVQGESPQLPKECGRTDGAGTKFASPATGHWLWGFLDRDPQGGQSRPEAKRPAMQVGGPRRFETQAPTFISLGVLLDQRGQPRRGADHTAVGKPVGQL